MLYILQQIHLCLIDHRGNCPPLVPSPRFPQERVVSEEVANFVASFALKRDPLIIEDIASSVVPPV